MRADYNHEIGYESLLKDFKRYQKQTPRGVSLKRNRNTINLQFKIGDIARKPYGCNCDFTLDGMVSALNKANKVAEKLNQLTSLSEFWEWYEKEIREVSEIKNDILTIKEAIALIENDFWNRSDRRRRKRDRNNPSDVSSWNDTYWRFYKHLPQDLAVNKKNLLDTLGYWKPGSKSYKSAVSVFKKLAKVANKEDIFKALDVLDVTQTEYKELQSVTLKDFFQWRNQVLGITKTLDIRCNLETRKAWLWAFSMQVVYGLRIHEVFAIQNLTTKFIAKDGVKIEALNNVSNTTNLIVIGDKTIIGTTTKTSYRIARPMIPNQYPDLIEKLNIKQPLLPDNRPIGKNLNSIRKFCCNTANRQLVRWNAPFTQTHALRHLANLDGIQAGIPQEVRAQSLGHTTEMNEHVYKKRQHTQTTIDILLNSNKQAIDFTQGLLEAKTVMRKHPDCLEAIIEVLAKVYQKSEVEIELLLD